MVWSRMLLGVAAVRYGLHACCVHTPSGGVQTPQDSLQHTWPAAHTLGPHSQLPFDTQMG